MAAIAWNIAIGLITSLISGSAVWVSARVRGTRRQRERTRFFGVSPGDTCRIVAPQHWREARAIARNDVFSVVELAKLVRDLRADTDLASPDASFGVGDATEFCVGGPESNVRTRSHLAHFLPGVTVLPYQEVDKSHAFIAGGRHFPLEADVMEHVLLAKVIRPGPARPLFLICGQTSITNRAAAAYLRDRYRDISSAHGERAEWCLILRAVTPSVYGHRLVEQAADITATAFAAPPGWPAGRSAH